MMEKLQRGRTSRVRGWRPSARPAVVGSGRLSCRTGSKRISSKSLIGTKQFSDVRCGERRVQTSSNTSQPSVPPDRRLRRTRRRVSPESLESLSLSFSLLESRRVDGGRRRDARCPRNRAVECRRQTKWETLETRICRVNSFRDTSTSFFALSLAHREAVKNIA